MYFGVNVLILFKQLRDTPKATAVKKMVSGIIRHAAAPDKRPEFRVILFAEVFDWILAGE